MSGSSGRAFEGIGTDSRVLVPGGLFWALAGERFDGHDFVSQALSDGAVGAVVSNAQVAEVLSHMESGVARTVNPALIRVPDTLSALGDLASWWRKRISLRVVGITGSCGKTTTKELTAAVLARLWPVAKTLGNFNNLIGLPLSLLAARPEDMWAVLEMGMNQPGEIVRLSRIASPEVGLITTVQPAHLEGVGDLDGVVREKAALWEALPEDGIAVVNLDDPLVVRAAAQLRCRRVGYTVGLGRENGAQTAPAPDCQCISWQPTEGGTRLRLKVGGEDLEVALSLIGRVNVANALAAAVVGHAVGLAGIEIRQGLEGVRPLGGRLVLKVLAGGRRLIDDSYNANPASMAAALETLKVWGRGSYRAAILGDMLELGFQETAFHHGLGEEAVSAEVDLLLAVGRHAIEVAEGARAKGFEEDAIRTFKDTHELLAWIEAGSLARLPSSLTVLVKGSRRMHLEKAVEALEHVFGQGQPERREG